MRCALHEGSLLDFQRRRERTRHDPQRRSVRRGSQSFKIVVERIKHAGTQSDDSSRASSTGGNTLRSEPQVPLQEPRWTATENPRCASEIPRDRQRPQLKRERCTKLQDMLPYQSWCQWCIAARAAVKPHLRELQPDTDEAVPRIEFDFANLGREEDQVLPIPSLHAVDVGFECVSATLCPTKAFSEYLLETILAFVEALGAVQNRRIKRSLVRHGSRIKARSKMRIE